MDSIARPIIEALMETGYSEVRANIAVYDVLGAMKKIRIERLEQFRNKRVLVEVEGLQVEVFVTDVKVTEEGVQYQVKPIAGDKHIWVRRFIKAL